MHIFYILFACTLCSVTLAHSSCVFDHPIHGRIDLTSIGFHNGHARFENISSSFSSLYTYAFNPCFSFTAENCRNVAVCQTTSDGSFSFPLATQNSSRWTIDASKTPVLTYNYGVKTVSIAMMCWTLDQHALIILQENPANYYSMRLYSQCACWNGCQTPSSTTRTTPKSSTTTNMISSNACQYHDSRYGTIDLSSIGSTTGVPAFHDLFTSAYQQYLWSYNPCYPFTESDCRNVSGCQIDRTRDIGYTLGLQENVLWMNMNPTADGIPSIVYRSPSLSRHLIVQLICNRSYSTAQLLVLGETSLGEYTMQLTSRCACWNECQSTPDPDPFNWNFAIILVCIGGVAFLFFCIIVTCLICSKPKRRYPRRIITDERTALFAAERKHESKI